MKPETHFGFGSIEQLGKALARYRARSLFLVTGDRSFRLSGAERLLRPILAGLEVHRFSGFSVNPDLEHLRSGIQRFCESKADAVVAVGGGSVIDMGKLINVYLTEGTEGKIAAGKPLIAIPTTAGSGSEATQFATLYIGKKKHSVSGEAVLPDVAIVDPVLTQESPRSVTAISGMDALAQAIESYWSVHSTDESKSYAREAIGLIIVNLTRVVKAPSEEPRLAMARGAHLAGKAINITRTTAPHALSYALTSWFGVPHGQAVSLTLPSVFAFNYEVTERDAADPRGPAHVKRALEEIALLLRCATVKESAATIRRLMHEIGLATTFSELGIDRLRAMEVMVREVNLERLANNPRKITATQLARLLPMT